MAHRSIAPVRQGIDATVLLRAAGTLRCLGHPLRLRLLEALESGEKTVTDLQEFASSSQAAVSQHLAIMKAHTVVSSRREGAFVYYRIVEPKVSAILACIRTCDL